jgi:excisionase family DNA binding protein
MSSNDQSQDAMLTAQQVAQLAQVSQFTVIREIHRGNLKAKKFGNRGGYRIRLQDCREWMTTPGDTQKVETQP